MEFQTLSGPQQRILLRLIEHGRQIVAPLDRQTYKVLIREGLAESPFGEKWLDNAPPAGAVVQASGSGFECYRQYRGRFYGRQRVYTTVLDVRREE